MASRAGSPPLLTGQVGRFLGLERLATAAGSPGATPYLVPIAGFVIDTGLLSGISYVLTGRDRFGSPFLLLIPVGLVAGVRLALWLRDDYVKAVRNLPGGGFDPTDPATPPTDRLRLGLFVVLYLGNLVELAVSPTELSTMIAFHGPVIASVNYLIADAFYLVVFADIAALLVAGLVLLPWRIYRGAVTLDFSDATGFAGLYDTSRLLRTGTVIYFLGMAAWTLWWVTPPRLTDATIEGPLFAVLWAGGVLLYIGPILLMHRRIGAEKRRHIERIDDEIRALDPDGHQRDGPYLTPALEDLPAVQQKFIELQQVRMTREYPVSMKFTQELIVTALIPMFIEWGLSGVV